MANLKFFAGIGTALILSSCAALNTVAQNTVAQTPAAKPAKNNLIGLFIVKRDNLKQQYRGEIFPIARYNNGRYTDASVDVTLDMRQNANEAEIVKRNAAKSVLNTKPTFNALNSQGGSIGKFSVDRLGIGQFACSSVLIGRGKLTGQPSVQAAFNQLPTLSERQLRGVSNGREFDETWRSTIATQLTPTAAPALKVTTPQFDQYRKDLLRIGTSEIAKIKEAQAVQGSVELIDAQVFDLDRDGKHEVYGKLRKAPATPVKPPVDRAIVTSIYANVWLGYAAPQAKVLSTQVVPYYVPSGEVARAYQVLGTIDANGDGKQEVLIQNNGYESITFSIHELQNNQLKPVFTGAGYGC
ncbi:hypothetical protein ACQ4M3_10550 [Leptolyngbya sp. AN03gr2]|uniref:hypothetical protein n=1 Tax=unclassified Leptolyngbya TaxID=2650499 RepID=UPI003D320EE0